MAYRLLLIAVLLLAFADPARANWWIVRSSDEKCLVVDIEPTGNDKTVTKVGKDVYQTPEQAEARQTALQRIKGRRSASARPRKSQVRLASLPRPRWPLLATIVTFAIPTLIISLVSLPNT